MSAITGAALPHYLLYAIIRHDAGIYTIHTDILSQAHSQFLDSRGEGETAPLPLLATRQMGI